MRKKFLLTFLLLELVSFYVASQLRAAETAAEGVKAPDFTLQFAGKKANQTLSLYESYLDKEGAFKVLAIAFLSASDPQTFKEFELLTAPEAASGENTQDAVSDAQPAAPKGPVKNSDTLKSLKLLTALYASYHEKGFELLIILADKDLTKVAVFTSLAEKKKYAFPLLWDRHGIAKSRYKVDDMPKVTLIGADGKIFKMQNDFNQPAGRELNAMIRKNLGLPLDAALPPALEEILKNK